MATRTGAGRSYRMPNDRNYGVHVAGAKELRADFKAFGINAMELKPVHKQLAALAVPVAQQYVPLIAPSFDKRNRPPSGRLAASISGWATKTTAEVRAGRRSGLPYGGVQEYGWPAKNIPAKHFMQRAAVIVRPNARRLYEQYVWKLINRYQLASGKTVEMT